MAGRPKKIIPAGTSELTITVPNEIIAFLEIEAARQDMPIGRLIRRSVETHLALGDRLAQVEADMREVRGLHSEIKASLGEIAEFIARRERDYQLALAGNDRDVAEEVFAGDVMDEVRTYDDEDFPFDEEDAR